MLHACVWTFDVTGTVKKNLGTKQGLSGFDANFRVQQPRLQLHWTSKYRTKTYGVDSAEQWILTSAISNAVKALFGLD